MKRLLTPLCLALALLPCAALRAQSYTVIDLGTLGGTSSSAEGINQRGQVVGWASTANNAAQHAALFSNGTVTDLGTLGGSGKSVAMDVNYGGQAIGYSTPSGTGNQVPVFFDQSTCTRYAGSYVGALNDIGYAVGGAGGKAVLFANDVVTDLGGGKDSIAYGINSYGDVAGSMAGGSTPVIFSISAPGNPPVNIGGGGTGEAFAVNDSGIAVGYTGTANGVHAALFNGMTTDLGSLGGTMSYAFAINGSKQVVGFSTLAGDAVNHAFLYTSAASGMRDLNSLVVAGSGVSDITFSTIGRHINDWGQIAAEGKVIGGSIHGVLLNPTTPLTTVYTTGIIDSKLVSGMSYGLIPTVGPLVYPNSNQTTLRILGGVAGSSEAGGANRDVFVRLSAEPNDDPQPLPSEIALLSGTGNDSFVLQLSYNEALTVSLYGTESVLRLGVSSYYDNRHPWDNAVSFNNGGTALFAGNRAYDPATDFHLGTFGVDTLNNTVWAVINRSTPGYFAATRVTPVIPEPSSGLLGSFGLWILVFGRSRGGAQTKNLARSCAKTN